jgi:hypothetical protein
VIAILQEKTIYRHFYEIRSFLQRFYTSSQYRWIVGGCTEGASADTAASDEGLYGEDEKPSVPLCSANTAACVLHTHMRDGGSFVRR